MWSCPSGARAVGLDVHVFPCSAMSEDTHEGPTSADCRSLIGLGAQADVPTRNPRPVRTDHV